MKKKPNLILVEKDVDQNIQQLLHEQQIYTLSNIKRTVLQKVSRCTQCAVFESLGI